MSYQFHSSTSTARNINHTAYWHSKHLSSEGHRSSCCSKLFLPCWPRVLIHLHHPIDTLQLKHLIIMSFLRQDFTEEEQNHSISEICQLKSNIPKQMWGVLYFITRLQEIENRYASRFICFIISMSSKYLWYWSAETSPLLPSKIFPVHNEYHKDTSIFVCLVDLFNPRSCRTNKSFWGRTYRTILFRRKIFLEESDLSFQC